LICTCIEATRETVLADEDQEQDPDRWVSHTPCGQAFWQILSQWVWNLRLEFGQHVSASPMRVTELAYAQLDEPLQASEPLKASELVQADASVSYGPAQWARRSFTKGFAGAVSLRNPMERCGVPPITRSPRKSVERSAMARCGCSMPPALAIVAAVLCAHSARKTPPPANRGA
jgi:hypothetical protein